MVFIFHLKHPRLQVFLFFICVCLLFNLVWKRNLLTVLYMAGINNRLLTEREGQYFPVRPKQARLVSGLLYGTVSDSKMQWHSVSDSKMQLQKRFVTESDKSSS